MTIATTRSFRHRQLPLVAGLAHSSGAIDSKTGSTPTVNSNVCVALPALNCVRSPPSLAKSSLATRLPTFASGPISSMQSDGYGIVRVDHDTNEFVLECWPYAVDPTAGEAGQFAGWPYRVSLDALRRE